MERKKTTYCCINYTRAASTTLGNFFPYPLFAIYFSAKNTSKNKMQISLWLCSIARNNEFRFLASSNTIVTSGFPAARAISRGFFFYYTWHTRDGQNALVRRHRSAMYRFARRSNLTFITNIARSEQTRLPFVLVSLASSFSLLPASKICTIGLQTASRVLSPTVETREVSFHFSLHR